MRQRNLTRTAAACSALFAVVLLLSACSSNSSSSSAGGGPTITLDGRNANDHGTQAVSGTDADVEVDSFYFQPTVLTGAAGDKVRLKITNDSTILHNFSLSDQSIDMDIPADGTISVSVTFPTSGTAVFFCKYHQSNGMVGALQVG